MFASLVRFLSFKMLFYADRATEVKIGIYVISFYSINEQTMVMRFGFFFVPRPQVGSIMH